MSNYAKLVEESKAHWEIFSPAEYAMRKAMHINGWLRAEGLNAVVIGISGGVDSAVCYKLLKLAQAQPGSPLKKISALSIPIRNSQGTTGQAEAVRLARLLGDDVETLDISAGAQKMAEVLAVEGNPFARGQMDYWLRPAILYGEAAELQTRGDYRAVVCGTINACEKFLGFYGYHTDPCDFCPITDLVKSRVFAVAKFLGVPEEIINAKPSGGVYSGATDEELIGASYEAVEAYMYGHKTIHPLWDEEAIPEFDGIAKQLNATHFKRRRPLDTVELPIAF